jgi:S1-C subfamily serine protease/HEAT repeat protein
MMQVICPQCDELVEVRTNSKSQRVRCPECEFSIRIDQLHQTPASAHLSASHSAIHATPVEPNKSKAGLTAALTVIALGTLLVVFLFSVGNRKSAAIYSGESIYEHARWGTTWIVCANEIPPRLSLGSGVAIHLGEKLILTNAHVVTASDEAMVFFPTSLNGQIETRPQHYLDNKKQLGFKGEVVYRDTLRDLALIRIKEMPGTVPVLALAIKSPPIRANLHAIGSSGVNLLKMDGALWRYSMGQVLQVADFDHVMEGDEHVKGRMIETQLPINRGDSGGPVLNDSGELVGIAQSADSRERLVSYCLDIREIREFLDRYSQSRQTTWREERPTAIQARAIGQNVAGKGSAGDTENPRDVFAIVHELEAESDSDEIEKLLGELEIQTNKAKPAIPSLIQCYAKSPMLTQRHILQLLDAIGPPTPAESSAVIALLGKSDTTLKQYALRMLQRSSDLNIPLVRQLLANYGNSDAVTRLQIIKLIQQTKADTPAQKLELSSVLLSGGFSEVKLEGIQRLQDQKLTPELIKVIIDQTANNDSQVRRGCLELLRKGEKDDLKLAIPNLIETLIDRDPKVCMVALELLSKAQVSGVQFFDRLLDLAKRPDPELQQAARAWIEGISFSPKDYQKLFDLLGNPSDPIRIIALRGLGEIGNQADPASERIADYLKPEHSVALRIQALTALAKIKPKATKLHDEIRAAASDPNPSVASVGVAVLGLLPESNESIKLLIRQSVNPASDVRTAAIDSLKAFLPFEEKHANVLMVGLVTESEPLRIVLLQGLAPMAKAIYPELSPLLEKIVAEPRATSPVLSEVFNVLTQLAPEYVPALDPLSKWITSDTLSKEARISLAKLLIKLNVKVLPTLASIRSALKTESKEGGDFEYATQLMVCIGSMGPKALPAGPELFEASMQDALRLPAHDAMRQVGGELTAIIVPDLKNRKPEIRLAAARALGAIQSEGNNATNRLAEISGNTKEQSNIRDAARDAMDQIRRNKKAK